MNIIINCTRCHGKGLYKKQPCPDCDGKGYTVVDKEKYYKQLLRAQKAMKEKKSSVPDCDHAEYDTKQVMDFKFNVCCKCGYQWKCDEGGEK